jgi:hypothetical protein
LRHDARELVEQIDEGHVKHEVLNISVRELEDGT